MGYTFTDMNTAKREAESIPITEQKRRREGVPTVKKLNFTRKNHCTTTSEPAIKSNEIQRKAGLKVRRSKRSRRRSSYSSCSESEVVVNEKKKLSEGKAKPLNAFQPSEQNNCCSTPVARQPSVACVPERVQELQAFSPASSSFLYEDDVALAALNLSEIITSSCGTSDTVKGDIIASSRQEGSNQFYGLPVKVKELLQKLKGIETLYGKISHQ